jgi:hypothetical protein
MVCATLNALPQISMLLGTIPGSWLTEQHQAARQAHLRLLPSAQGSTAAPQASQQPTPDQQHTHATVCTTPPPPHTLTHLRKVGEGADAVQRGDHLVLFRPLILAAVVAQQLADLLAGQALEVRLVQLAVITLLILVAGLCEGRGAGCGGGQ